MAPPVDVSDTRACHCLAVRRHARAITRLYEQRLRPHGLRATQFSVLAALAIKGPTAMTELADLLGLERTTLTRVGGPLERHGWIGADQGADARVRLLRITAAGRSKLERAYPAWKEAQELIDRQMASSPLSLGSHDTSHSRACDALDDRPPDC